MEARRVIRSQVFKVQVGQRDTDTSSDRGMFVLTHAIPKEAFFSCRWPWPLLPSPGLFWKAVPAEKAYARAIGGTGTGAPRCCDKKGAVYLQSFPHDVSWAMLVSNVQEVGFQFIFCPHNKPHNKSLLTLHQDFKATWPFPCSHWAHHKYQRSRRVSAGIWRWVSLDASHCHTATLMVIRGRTAAAGGHRPGVSPILCQ